MCSRSSTNAFVEVVWRYIDLEIALDFLATFCKMFSSTILIKLVWIFIPLLAEFDLVSPFAIESMMLFKLLTSSSTEI